MYIGILYIIFISGISINTYKNFMDISHGASLNTSVV